jgi:tetratricopeptide (TPR) repeat protein
MLRHGVFITALCAVVGVSSAAQAADEALVLRMSAERQAAQGQCEQAITTARRARALAPNDAAAAAVEGRCLLELKRYSDAAPVLADARRLAPNDAEVAVQNVMVQYHLGNTVEAERALADAERLAPNDARTQLYKGLLLTQRAQEREGAEVLERAASLDPNADPYASYYAGMAWQRANERERARQALERARAAGGEWGAEAERALVQLDAGDVAARYFVRARVGMEWDSNVILEGDDVTVPDDISGKEDWRGVWSLRAGAEAFRTRNWSGGIIGGYQGSAHIDLHEFDLQYPTASLWLDRRIDSQSFLRLQPYAGYAWEETDPYLAHTGGELSYYRSYDEAGWGRLWGRVGYQNYLYSVQAAEDRVSRDGWEYLGGYEHTVPFDTGTTIRAGVVGGAYDADGRDYDYATGGGYGGIRQELPFEFAVDLSGGFDYESYEHHSIFDPRLGSTPDRRDKIWTAQAELERPLTDWLILSGRYRYRDNDSNVGPFDYHRHIAGGYLTVVWAE